MFPRAYALILLALAAPLSAGGGIARLDSLATAALQGSNRYPAWDIAVESVALASPFIEGGWSLGWYIHGRMAPDPRAEDTGIQCAAALLLTQAASLGLKYTLRRERPPRSYQPRLWNTRITPSFPSGHTASSATWATVAALRYPEYKHIFIVYTLASAYSQVYTGNHYLGDVIAGAVLGFAVGKCVVNQLGSEAPASDIWLALPPRLVITIPLP